MCTAISYTTKSHYFGRNLDLELSLGETVTVTPRRYPLSFRKVSALRSHYAIIGMAYVTGGYPLYYDAINEKGVGMAGLNFPDNSQFSEPVSDKDNIAPFEFIPWVLSQCACLGDVCRLLERINLVNIDFSDVLPVSPLHWMISDKNGSVTVESTKAGMCVYDNPVGVLTNNPAFDMQLFNLNNYMSMSAKPPENRLSERLELHRYSRGMGAIGLPGDLSSASRFVRAVFTKENSVYGDSEQECVTQFFHILGSVYQQRGCVNLGRGKYEHTLYSSCCNADKGVYYYTTYGNSRITCVDMHKEKLEGETLISYPLLTEQDIKFQN